MYVQALRSYSPWLSPYQGGPAESTTASSLSSAKSLDGGCGSHSDPPSWRHPWVGGSSDRLPWAKLHQLRPWAGAGDPLWPGSARALGNLGRCSWAQGRLEWRSWSWPLGCAGWFLPPPLGHDLFQKVVLARSSASSAAYRLGTGSPRDKESPLLLRPPDSLCLASCAASWLLSFLRLCRWKWAPSPGYR